MVRGRIDPALLDTPAATPSAAASSPSRPRATTASSSPMKNCCPSRKNRCSIASRCPTASSTKCSSSLQAEAARVPATVASCPRTPSEARTAAASSPSRKTWKDRSRRAKSSSPARRPIPQCRPSAAGRATTGRAMSMPALRPELKTVAKRQAVRLACRVPARHVAERASRSLRRQHEAAAEDPGKRPDIKQFNILTFNVGAAWLEPKGWLRQHAAGRDKALKQARRHGAGRRDRLSAAPGQAGAPGLRHRRGHDR